MTIPNLSRLDQAIKADLQRYGDKVYYVWKPNQTGTCGLWREGMLEIIWDDGSEPTWTSKYAWHNYAWIKMPRRS